MHTQPNSTDNSSKGKQEEFSSVQEEMDSLCALLEEEGLKEGDVLMECDFSPVDLVAMRFAERESQYFSTQGETVVKTYRG